MFLFFFSVKYLWYYRDNYWMLMIKFKELLSHLLILKKKQKKNLVVKISQRA